MEPELASSSVLVLGSVAFAVFVAAASHVSLCTRQYDCLSNGDCIVASSSMSAWFGGSCSFQNAVSVTSLELANMSSSASLATMSRGVCSPGEIQSVRSASGLMRCSRQPSFPDAFVSSAGDPSANSFHMRAAGKWIASKRGQKTSFGFFDAESIANLVEDDIVYGFDPRTAHNDFDRFRAVCESTLASGAMAFDASTTYAFLKAELTGLDVLKSVGKLSSYLCDTPVNFASDLNADGNGWVAKAIDGNMFSVETIDSALYSFGDGFFTRQRAREFAETALGASLSDLSVIEASQVNSAFEASVLGSNIDDAVVIGSYTVSFTQDLISFARFLHALGVHGAVHAKAYLRGVNAMCVSAIRSSITGASGLEAPVSAALEGIRKKSNFNPVALGRFEFDVFAEPTREHVAASLSMRPSSLFSFAIVDLPRKSCFDAAKKLFSDAYDKLVFDRLVGSELNTRLTTLIAEMKGRVNTELLSGQTRFLIASEADRTRIASFASSAVVTIPGSEPLTGGLSLSSSDGPVTIALKQSRLVFLDNMGLALDFRSVCELPALMAATTRNAYILSNSNCVWLLPGILVPPLASIRYDQSSLRSRIGYVVAHELGHLATMSPLSTWNWTFATTLMANYTSSTYTEAAADLIAVSSLRGLVSDGELCSHTSQLWAASPAGYGPQGPSPHPVMNLRGDNLCGFVFR